MCLIGRDGEVVLIDRSEDIAALQARCQELEAFRLDVAAAIQRPKTCSVKGLTVYVRETIKFLENERLEQAAYIKRLEEYITSGIKYSANCDGDCSRAHNDGTCEECEKIMAREALEAIKRGD